MYRKIYSHANSIRVMMMMMMMIWGTTVRNKDEELKTFWESIASSGISYGGLHEEVVRHT